MELIMGAGASIEGNTNECGLVTSSALDFPKHGVRLSFYNHFVDLCGGRNNLEGLTTTEVCERYVKPATFTLQCSYCDMLRQNHSTATDIATVFISHAWAYKFLDVCDALLYHFKDQLDTVIWFDLFAVNQHTTSSKPFEWWTGTFQYAIRDFGKTVMVFAPWNDPIPLRRAWCLWELYSTVKMQCIFEVAMSESEQLRFFNDIGQDANEAINQMLVNINVEQSQSFNPLDKERIFEIVRTTIGFATLNQTVFERLRLWAIATTQSRIDNGELDKKQLLLMKFTLAELLFQQADYYKANTLYTELLEPFLQEFSIESSKGIQFLFSIANSRLVLTQYVEAKKFFEQLIDIQISLSGDERDPLAMHAKQKLGLLYERSGDIDKAKENYIEAYEAFQQKLGDRDKRTLSALKDLAAFYGITDNKTNAKELYDKAYNLCKEVYGENHQETLDVKYNQGTLLYDIGETQQALDIIYPTYTTRVITLGESHITTLDTMQTLAYIYEELGNINQAKEIVIKRINIYDSFYGPTSLGTLKQKGDIAKWLDEQNDNNLAEKYYKEWWKGYYDLNGPNDHLTKSSFKCVKLIYQKQGKNDEFITFWKQYSDVTI